MLDIVYGMNESKEVEKFIHLADHVSLGLEKSGDRNIINIFPFSASLAFPSLIILAEL